MRNAPAPVFVKAVEKSAPGCQETPEAAEFFEIDGPRAVGVEHADHHLDGVRVEGCVVAVDERAAEFGLGKLAAAVFVDLHEEGPEAVAVVLVAGRRADGGRALLLGDWRAVVGARGWRALAVVCGRRGRGEGWALLLLRRRLGVLLWVVEARGWRLRVGVVGCVVAGLLVPVLRWWRRGARGAVGAWYGAWRLEALVRRRPVAVAVVGAHVLVLLRWGRHGFVVLRTAWRRAGVAVWIHELCCLLGFGVSGGRVSCQPFVAGPVDVRMSSHDVAGSTSTCMSSK